MRYDIAGIGERIADLREAKGWQRIDLTRKLNVQDHRVNNWESGAFYPSLVSLVELCEILDCKITDLISEVSA